MLTQENAYVISVILGTGVKRKCRIAVYRIMIAEVQNMVYVIQRTILAIVYLDGRDPTVGIRLINARTSSATTELNAIQRQGNVSVIRISATPTVRHAMTKRVRTVVHVSLMGHVNALKDSPDPSAMEILLALYAKVLYVTMGGRVMKTPGNANARRDSPAQLVKKLSTSSHVMSGARVLTMSCLSPNVIRNVTVRSGAVRP